MARVEYQRKRKRREKLEVAEENMKMIIGWTISYFSCHFLLVELFEIKGEFQVIGLLVAIKKLFRGNAASHLQLDELQILTHSLTKCK